MHLPRGTTPALALPLRLTRRRGATRRHAGLGWLSIALLVAMTLGAWLPVAAAPAQQATPVARGDLAAQITAIANDAMARYALKAVILRVTIDGKEVVTTALGESMTGVPATTDMHFRNGAVAISYMSTLLLQLVDQGVVGLDDPLAKYLPDLPDADRVTLRMLANMTAGYPDFVQNAQFIKAIYEDPFRAWTAEEQIDIGLSTPRVFAPGTNWDYSHTNYVILGKALEAATGTALAELLQQNVLDPLGLEGTVAAQTATIPEPVLHAFTSERRQALAIPDGVRFYEESTFWNPSWTLAEGSVETTTITDMATTAEAIGEGTLLTPASHAAQIDPGLLGFGSPLAGCPNCHTLDEQYNYGLGIVLRGDWLLQNPLFAGTGGTEGYLPEKKIAIAVVTTFDEGSFDEQGDYRYGNASQQIFESIAELLAPGSMPTA